MVNTFPKSISEKTNYMFKIQQDPQVKGNPRERVKEQFEVINHKPQKGKYEQLID
jgi:hypothetical protein